MQRESNIEMLRIVAMSFILINHFLCHSIKIDGMNPWLYQGLVITNICGVNLFVMISGYFGIRSSVKSFVKLAGMIVFYSVVCLIIGVEIFDMQVTLAKIIKAFIMPFTSQYWFLECYLGLYILAPLINKGLENLTHNELKNVVLILTIISVFSCWYGNNMIGNNGYGLFHFIYIYVLGNFLRHNRLKNTSVLRWLLIGMLALVVNIGVTYMFDVYFGIFENRFWNENATSYDNPLIIIATIAIFLCFVNMNMKVNGYINSIAAASLGCYLLQDVFLRTPVYNIQHNLVISEPVSYVLLMYFGAFVAYWVFSYVLYRVYSVGYKLLSQAKISASYRI